MFRLLAMYALLAAPLVVSAQMQIATNVVPVASASVAPETAALPDAPSAVSSSLAMSDGQSGVAPSAGSSKSVVAPKYAGIILPGQATVPLSASDKFVYGLHDAFNPYAFAGVTLSAAYSQVVGSAPHYGPGGEGFGKREGVSALRNTVQTLSTDVIFAPIFHDDPRYYELGRSHRFVPRVVYAATRVLITRSDSGHNRLNAPLLLGYGVAAGLNNLYYPDQDTGGKQTAEQFGSSLAGAALGLEANEFFDDFLRAIHLRKH